MAGDRTAQELLDVAQTLIQERGYNAFSYRDLADAVGIRTASIHYHFKTKADLAQALMARYDTQFQAQLSQIDHDARSALGKLKRFVHIFRSSYDQGRICLCASLASDLATLPDELAGSIAAFLKNSERWVKRVIDEGIASKELDPITSPADIATMLVAAMHGGLLEARAAGSPRPLLATERVLLKILGE